MGKAEGAEIVGQEAQRDFAVLAEVGARSQGCTHVSPGHVADGFDWPTLAVRLLWDGRGDEITSPIAGLTVAGEAGTMSSSCGLFEWIQAKDGPQTFDSSAVKDRSGG